MMEILEEIDPDIDYTHETRLIDDRVLDSFSILTLISEICEVFDIEIGPKWMRNENFNSVAAMWHMIQSIQAEQ